MYCSDITRLIIKFGIEYKVYNEDFCKFFKTVLLNIGNQYILLPVHLRESYENLELVPEKIKYMDHGWMVFGDFKRINHNSRSAGLLY